MPLPYFLFLFSYYLIFLHHKITKKHEGFFYIRNENFLLQGIEGAHEFTNYFTAENGVK